MHPTSRKLRLLNPIVQQMHELVELHKTMGKEHEAVRKIANEASTHVASALREAMDTQEATLYQFGITVFGLQEEMNELVVGGIMNEKEKTVFLCRRRLKKASDAMEEATGHSDMCDAKQIFDKALMEFKEAIKTRDASEEKEEKRENARPSKRQRGE